MSLKSLIIRTQQIVKRINTLAQISESPHCLTRTYGTEALSKANNLFCNWMQAAGLQIKRDTIGNVRGKLTASHSTPQTFFMGSHLDSVRNAGKFDGPLGLLIALDVVEQLSEAGVELPFNIEVVGFCDEEGTRFTTTYLGSSVLSNTFEPKWLARQDDTGMSIGELVKRQGGDPTHIPKEGLQAHECIGYYEVHIEQGPVLENADIPVGIVTSIAGQSRVEIEFKGKAGHAGTTPMNMRQDALCAAASFVVEVENYAQASENPLVATVGKLVNCPNAPNVIPSSVVCSLDLRSPDNEVMYQAIEDLEAVANQICEARNLNLDWTLLQQNKAVYCDAQFCELLAEAIEQTAVEKVIKLASGAGHDAVALSKIMPVSMLFVQCKDGISHHPDEFVKFDDICAAVRVSELFVKGLIKTHQAAANTKHPLSRRQISKIRF